MCGLVGLQQAWQYDLHNQGPTYLKILKLCEKKGKIKKNKKNKIIIMIKNKIMQMGCLFRKGLAVTRGLLGLLLPGTHQRAVWDSEHCIDLLHRNYVTSWIVKLLRYWKEHFQRHKFDYDFFVKGGSCYQFRDCLCNINHFDNFVFFWWRKINRQQTYWSVVRWMRMLWWESSTRRSLCGDGGRRPPPAAAFGGPNTAQTAAIRCHRICERIRTLIFYMCLIPAL